jgi:hypothetical protein
MQGGCRLAIVSSDIESQSKAAVEHPCAWVAGSIEELDAGGYHWRECLAVITLRAGSHYQIFHQLAYYGVRHMVFEEALAESASELAGMAERAAKEGISIRVSEPSPPDSYEQFLADLTGWIQAA